MTNESESDCGWEPCRPGLIQQASVQAIDKRRRAFLVKCSAGAVVAFGGLLAASFGIGRAKPQVSSDPKVVGCREVLDNMELYVRKEIEDDSFYAGIAVHLKECGYCDNVHQETIRQQFT